MHFSPNLLVLCEGIPTTRAATLVISDDVVVRDRLYNGNPQKERAAIVLRVAPSWFRFGSFEHLAKSGEIDLLRDLTDFIIKYYFADSIDINEPHHYLALFSEVTAQTARLIALWQSVGFAHGVCNTDNFSILSLTLDYGPFRFLDDYDPEMVPNTSDDEHRYSYQKQPNVGKYNLERLRDALTLLFDSYELQQSWTVLQNYDSMFKSQHLKIFRRKLGLTDFESEDEGLIARLLSLMEATSSDFTMTFNNLGNVSLTDLALELNNRERELWALKALSQHSAFDSWLSEYKARLCRAGVSDDRRRSVMRTTNPRYVLRNWIAQTVIDGVERNDFTMLRTVAKILESPFEIQPTAESLGFSTRPPAWARHLKVSCSS
jgi:uncharacterized protein YdiU (UPF0061 family)